MLSRRHFVSLLGSLAGALGLAPFLPEGEDGGDEIDLLKEDHVGEPRALSEKTPLFTSGYLASGDDRSVMTGAVKGHAGVDAEVVEIYVTGGAVQGEKLAATVPADGEWHQFGFTLDTPGTYRFRTAYKGTG